MVGEAFACKLSGKVHFCRPDATCPSVVGTQPGTLVCKISGKVIAEEIIPEHEGPIQLIDDEPETSAAAAAPGQGSRPVEALQSAGTVRAIFDK